MCFPLIKSQGCGSNRLRSSWSQRGGRRLYFSKHLKASQEHGPDFCDVGQNCPSHLKPRSSCLASEMELLQGMWKWEVSIVVMPPSVIIAENDIFCWCKICCAVMFPVNFCGFLQLPHAEVALKLQWFYVDEVCWWWGSIVHYCPPCVMCFCRRDKWSVVWNQVVGNENFS